MQATRILAIRHGETDWNRASRIQGQTDIALNAQGLWQAQRLGLALGTEALAAIYSSDLGRAQQTAQCLAEHHAMAVQTDPALRERGFGEFEGMTWSELEAAQPEAIRRWRQRDPDFAPPGGETLVQLQQRVVAAGGRREMPSRVTTMPARSRSQRAARSASALARSLCFSILELGVRGNSVTSST